MIHNCLASGGANTAEWDFNDDTQQVRDCSVEVTCSIAFYLAAWQGWRRMLIVLDSAVHDQLLRRAGTLLMQREVPEPVNLQAAQVPHLTDSLPTASVGRTMALGVASHPC